MGSQRVGHKLAIDQQEEGRGGEERGFSVRSLLLPFLLLAKSHNLPWKHMNCNTGFTRPSVVHEGTEELRGAG